MSVIRITITPVFYKKYCLLRCGIIETSQSKIEKFKNTTKTSKSVTQVAIVQLGSVNKNIATNAGPQRFGTRGAFQIAMHAKSANVRNTHREQ